MPDVFGVDAEIADRSLRYGASSASAAAATAGGLALVAGVVVATPVVLGFGGLAALLKLLHESLEYWRNDPPRDNWSVRTRIFRVPNWDLERLGASQRESALFARLVEANSLMRAGLVAYEKAEGAFLAASGELSPGVQPRANPENALARRLNEWRSYSHDAGTELSASLPLLATSRQGLEQGMRAVAEKAAAAEVELGRHSNARFPESLPPEILASFYLGGVSLSTLRDAIGGPRESLARGVQLVSARSGALEEAAQALGMISESLLEVEQPPFLT